MTLTFVIALQMEADHGDIGNVDGDEYDNDNAVN